MKISKELYTFFKEWLEWAEDGGKEGGVFYNHAGLCSNLVSWCDSKESELAQDELTWLLMHSGLDVNYPFSQEDYLRRLFNDTQHECPMRLAFVREQIKKYEEE